MVFAALVAGCGGGGSAGDTAAQTPSAPPASIAGLNSSGDIVDDSSVYSDVSPDPIDEVDVVVLPPTPGGKCTADDGTGKEDYSGCTLADVNGDTNGDDAFDPSVRVHFTASDYPDDGMQSNAELEIRGSSTRFADQKSYKIKLDKGLPKWHGQRELQLNKHPYDLTRIRNKLSFDLFRMVPDFTSLRTQFVHMFLTDEGSATNNTRLDYGLFTHVEKDDDHWADAHGQDSDSNIFKPTQFEFLPVAATPALNQPVGSVAFESVLKSEGKNEDLSVLFAMLGDINDHQDYLSVDYGNDFEAVFQKYFHPDNFRTWLALNILLSNLDTNSQNFYLYRPTTISTFYFTPWDYDGAWDFDHQPPGAPQPRWTEGISNWWGMTLVRRFIEAPGEIQQLTDKINSLHNTVVNAATAQQIINSYPMSQIDAIEQSPPDSTYLPIDTGSSESAAQQRQDEIARLPGTIDQARTQYLNDLERPMPVFQNVEVINGVVTLEWDPSYDIQGDPLVYDVTLASSPDMAANSTTCTQQPSEPVPVLSNNVVLQQNGTTGTSLNAASLAPGRYYLQVIVRDDKGYCQTAFDEYDDSAGDAYFGLFAFDYDGNTVTPVN